MKRNQVILIYGMPASGKYTVAKQIQEKCGGVLLDNHYFYDLFIDKTEGSDERWFDFVRSVSSVRKAFFNVLREFYPKKHPTRYIFTGVYSRGEKGPARLQKFARDIGADFIPIELTVKKEVLISRCDTSERRKRKKLSDRKKYSNFVEDWMSGAYHSRHVNTLVLDSSEQTAEETFKLVKKYLKKFD